MPDNGQPYDDEIDLLGLFDTIWDGKWIIIAATFAAALMGLVYTTVVPTSYEVSTTIDRARPSAFVEYTSLNDILSSEVEKKDSEENSKGSELISDYEISSEFVFEMFLTEFSDYEEMVSVLTADAGVAKLMAEIEERERDSALFQIAKSFRIVSPKSPEDKGVISLEWHDVDQGKILFSAAIKETLENVKRKILADINKIALSLDQGNARELERLQVQLSLLLGSAELQAERQIQSLKEQAAIARELGIEGNQLGSNDMARPESSDFSLNARSVEALPLNVNSAELLVYLRGYKAIEKEIALLEGRSPEQVLIGETKYSEIMDEIALIESDILPAQIRNSLKVVEDADPSEWIYFDFRLADEKSNRLLILALSVGLGGFVSLMYVLISSAMRKRKSSADQSMQAVVH